MEIVEVKLFGKTIGKLGREINKPNTYFILNEEFLNTYGMSPLPGIKETLKPQLFNDALVKDFEYLPPLFYSSLPDSFGNKILEKYLETKHKPPLSPMQKLSYLGTRSMGGFEYFPEIELHHIQENINLTEVENIAHEILEEKQSMKPKQFKKGIENIIRLGGSLGGAQPKVLIAMDKEQNIYPGDITYSDKTLIYSILKLGRKTNQNETDYSCQIEYAYYLMAKNAGILMSDCQLYDDKYFLTERFDRDRNGTKKHMISAKAFLASQGIMNDHNYESIFYLIENNSSIPNINTETLYRQMLFNYMAKNTDDHSKNFSFVYDTNYKEWNLSPAYDITLPVHYKYANYPKAKNAMAFQGKQNGHSYEEFESFAKNKLFIRNASSIKEQIAESLNNFETYAQKALIPTPIAKQIKSGFRFL